MFMLRSFQNKKTTSYSLYNIAFPVFILPDSWADLNITDFTIFLQPPPSLLSMT